MRAEISLKPFQKNNKSETLPAWVAVKMMDIWFQWEQEWASLSAEERLKKADLFKTTVHQLLQMAGVIYGRTEIQARYGGQLCLKTTCWI